MSEQILDRQSLIKSFREEFDAFVHNVDSNTTTHQITSEMNAIVRRIFDSLDVNSAMDLHEELMNALVERMNNLNLLRRLGKES